MTQTPEIETEEEREQWIHDEAVKRGQRWANEFQNSLLLRFTSAIIIGAIIGFIFS